MKKIITLFFALAIGFGSSAQIYLDEDFSTFVNPVLPPLSSGWKNADSISNRMSDSIWRFDNPGIRTPSLPITTPFASADGDWHGTPWNDDTYLSSTNFDASLASVVILEFDHYYRTIGTGTGELQIYNGTNWVTDTFFTVNTDPTVSFITTHEVIDISQYVVGISNAQIRFRYTDPGWGWYWILDNVIVFQPVPDDAAVVSVDSLPVSACSLDSNETITASVVNFGSTVIRNIPIRYSINGGAIVPETIIDSIIPGDTLQYSFATKANLSAAGSYNIVVYSAIRGDNNNVNDSAFFTTTLNPAITSYPYSEGFESGNGAWVSGGVNSTWAVGIPSGTIINSAANGLNAYVTNPTGDYLNGDASFVLSPCFDFSSLNAPQIKMNIWYDSESSWDGAVLQMTINDGITWTQVGAFGNPNNWYNDNTINGLQAAGFSGAGWTIAGGLGSGGWLLAEHDLPSSANEPSVRFRVFHGTDGSVTRDGFAFDDIIIQDAPAIDVGITSFTSPVSGCGLGAADSVCVTMINYGSSPAVNIPVAYEFSSQQFTDTAFITLNPGDSTTFCFSSTINVSINGTYNIKSYSMAAGDGNALNDTANFTFDHLPLISNFPYIEGFENGSGGWISSGINNSWSIGVPNGSVINTAAGGFGAWVTNLTGNHNNNENSFIESPCLDLSSLTVDPILYFSLTYDTESCCDEGWVDYSTDGGNTWSRLIDNGGALEWYNDLGNQWWDGTSSGGAGVWVNAENELDGLAGQASVKIRFGFSSDGSVAREGVGIDNVRIDLPPRSDVGAIALTSPVTGCGLSSSDSVRVQIQNFGADTLTSTPVSYELNGGAAVTETITTTVLPGATLSYTFTSTLVNLSVPGNYSFKVYTGAALDGNPLNDTITATIASIPIATFPYSEGFETSNGGWTTSGAASSWAWGTPAGSVISSAATGTGAWVTNLSGFYNNRETSYVESPCFDLSAQTMDPVLRFSLTFDTESCCDEGWVDVSTDGGVTWTKSIDLGGAQNWYNDLGNQWWDGANVSGSGIWDSTSNILTGVAGFPSVKFRFAFSSDGSAVREGFGVDNVSLDMPVSIHDASPEEGIVFSLYPNPTKEEFTLVAPTTKESLTIEILDTKGQLVYRKEIPAISARIHKIDISSIANGIYFVKINSGSIFKIEKLIIQ
ncbi:T9SS type A sorting domain-containing protein [Vicingaceae bacterium]|nr:T9SS type A sorting domain-containing protein [Vicingaceae bacterium]